MSRPQKSTEPTLYPVADIAGSPQSVNLADEKLIVRVTNVKKVTNDQPFDPADPWRDYRFYGQVLNADENTPMLDNQGNPVMSSHPTYVEFTMSSNTESQNLQSRNRALLSRLHVVELLKDSSVDLSIYESHVNRNSNVEHAKLTDFRDRHVATHLLQYGLNPAPDGTAPFDLSKVTDQAREQFAQHMARIEDKLIQERQQGITQRRNITPAELLDATHPELLSSKNVGLTRKNHLYDNPLLDEDDEPYFRGNAIPLDTITADSTHALSKIVLNVSPDIYNDLYERVHDMTAFNALTADERTDLLQQWHIYKDLYTKVIKTKDGQNEIKAVRCEEPPSTAMLTLDMPATAVTKQVTPTDGTHPYKLIQAKYTAIKPMFAPVGVMTDAYIMPSLSYNPNDPTDSHMSLCQVESVQHHAFGNVPANTPDDKQAYYDFLASKDNALGKFGLELANAIIQNSEAQAQDNALLQESQHLANTKESLAKAGLANLPVEATLPSSRHVTVELSALSYKTHNRAEAGEIYYSRKNGFLPTVSFTDFRPEKLKGLATLTDPDYQDCLDNRIRIEKALDKRVELISSTFFADIRKDFFGAHNEFDAEKPFDFVTAHKNREQERTLSRYQYLPEYFREKYSTLKTHNGQVTHITDEEGNELAVDTLYRPISIMQQKMVERIAELLPQFREKFVEPLKDGETSPESLRMHDLHTRKQLWRDLLVEMDVSLNEAMTPVLNKHGETIGHYSLLGTSPTSNNPDLENDENFVPDKDLYKAIDPMGSSVAHLTAMRAMNDLRIMQLETQAVLLNLPVVHDSLVDAGVLAKDDVARANAYKGVGRTSAMWRLFDKPFGEDLTPAEKESGWVAHPLSGLSMSQVTTLSGTKLTARNLFIAMAKGLNVKSTSLTYRCEFDELHQDRSYSEKLKPQNSYNAEQYAQAHANASYSMACLGATVMQGNHFDLSHNIFTTPTASAPVFQKRKYFASYLDSMFNHLQLSDYANGTLHSRSGSGIAGLEKMMERLEGKTIQRMVDSTSETGRAINKLMAQALMPQPSMSKFSFGLGMSYPADRQVPLPVVLSVVDTKTTGVTGKNYITPRLIGDSLTDFMKTPINTQAKTHGVFNEGKPNEIHFTSDLSPRQLGEYINLGLKHKDIAKKASEQVEQALSSGVGSLDPNSAPYLRLQKDIADAQIAEQRRDAVLHNFNKGAFVHADAVIGVTSVSQQDKTPSLYSHLSQGMANVVVPVPNQASATVQQSNNGRPTSLDGALAEQRYLAVVSILQSKREQQNEQARESALLMPNNHALVSGARNVVEDERSKALKAPVKNVEVVVTEEDMAMMTGDTDTVVIKTQQATIKPMPFPSRPKP